MPASIPHGTTCLLLAAFAAGCGGEVRAPTATTATRSVAGDAPPPAPIDVSAADHWPGSALVAVPGMGRLSFGCTDDRRFYTWWRADRMTATQSAGVGVGRRQIRWRTVQPGETAVSPTQLAGRQRWQVVMAHAPGTVTATIDVSFAVVGGACLAPRVELTRRTESNATP